MVRRTRMASVNVKPVLFIDRIEVGLTVEAHIGSVIVPTFELQGQSVRSVSRRNYRIFKKNLEFLNY